MHKKLSAGYGILNIGYWIFVFYLLLPAQAKTAETVSYHDDAWHYAIEVPVDWQVNHPKASNRVIVLAKVKNPGYHNHQIVLTVLKEKIVIPQKKSELAMALGQLTSPLLRMPGISKPQILESDLGHTKKEKWFYFKTTYLFQPKGGAKPLAMINLSYFREIKDRSFSLTLIGPKNGFEKTAILFEQVMNSLQINSKK